MSLARLLIEEFHSYVLREPVFVNPTLSEIGELVQFSYERAASQYTSMHDDDFGARWILDTKTDEIYAFPADKYTHSNMAPRLGLKASNGGYIMYNFSTKELEEIYRWPSADLCKRVHDGKKTNIPLRGYANIRNSGSGAYS